MAEAITDRQVVAVLRPFVRATGPVLDAVREAGPVRLRRRALPAVAERAPVRRRGRWARLARRLVAVRAPGTARWAAMDPAERTDWWINRVGRLTALVASVPNLGGALAARLPVRPVVGAAGQGLLLCAIAGEYGCTAPADRVRLLAWVLFGRRISPELAAGGQGTTSELDGPDGVGAEARRAAELTEELTASRRAHGRATLAALGRTVWRLGRALWALEGELDKRPRGRFYHEALGMLPVAGVLGGYLGERSALRRARRAALKWIRAERRALPSPVR